MLEHEIDLSNSIIFAKLIPCKVMELLALRIRVVFYMLSTIVIPSIIAQKHVISISCEDKSW